MQLQRNQNESVTLVEAKCIHPLDTRIRRFFFECHAIQQTTCVCAVELHSYIGNLGLRDSNGLQLFIAAHPRSKQCVYCIVVRHSNVDSPTGCISFTHDILWPMQRKGKMILRNEIANYE